VIYSIQLFGDEHEEVYCGCWFVPCPIGDEYAAGLEASGFGFFRGDDGERQRAFFFDTELADQLAKAELVTGCHAKACPARAVAKAIA